MAKFYKIICAKCNFIFVWDKEKPLPCPQCGSKKGFYKKFLVKLTK